MITAGIIGCGKIALERHIPAIVKNRSIKLIAVSDLVSENMKYACRIAGDTSCKSYSDYNELLKQKPDYVVLCVPPNIREEIIESCIKAGVNVLTEKPLSITPESAQIMIKDMYDAGLKFGIVHNYIFYPEYILAKELIDNGAIGDLRHITMNFMGMKNNGGISSYKPDWRVDRSISGGGILMDMIHTVYMSEYFFSSRVKTVQSVIDNKDNPDISVEDMALITLGFETGYSVINLWWGNGSGGMIISGTKGRIIINYKNYNTGPFDLLDNVVLVNNLGKKEYSPRSENCDDLCFEQIHKKFYQHLISENNDLLFNSFLSASSGYNSLLIVDAAYKSAVTGRVVDINYFDEEK
jgi:predicted dehydrogenase